MTHKILVKVICVLDKIIKNIHLRTLTNDNIMTNDAYNNLCLRLGN